MIIPLLSRFFFSFKMLPTRNRTSVFKGSKAGDKLQGEQSKELLKILPSRFQERKKTYRKCGKQARYRDAIKELERTRSAIYTPGKSWAI